MSHNPIHDVVTRGRQAAEAAQDFITGEDEEEERRKRARVTDQLVIGEDVTPEEAVELAEKEIEEEMEREEPQGPIESGEELTVATKDDGGLRVREVRTVPREGGAGELTEQEREELRRFAEEQGITPAGPRDDFTREGFEDLRQQKRIQRLQKGGLTPSEKAELRAGLSRVEQAGAISQAQQQEQEIQEQAEQQRQNIEGRIQNIRDAPAGTRFRFAGADFTISKEDALKVAEEDLKDLEQEEIEASGGIQDFISERVADINILSRRQDVLQETDPLGGETADVRLRDLSPVERFTAATGTLFSEEGAELILSAVDVAAGGPAGPDQQLFTAKGGISDVTPGQLIEEEATERAQKKRAAIVRGDFLDVPGTNQLFVPSLFLEEGLAALTQSPLGVLTTSFLAGAGIGRGIQASRAASPALGKAVQIGAGLGGGALVTREGFRIKKDFEQGEALEGLGKGLRLGTAIGGAFAGAKAVQPRVTSTKQDVRTKPLGFRRQPGGSLRGAGQATVKTTRTVQQPRILRAPKDVTQQFLSRVNLRPIRAKGGVAFGRGTVQTFRTPQKGTFNIDLATGRQFITPIRALRKAGPTGPQKVFLFESKAAQATPNLPFTQRLPTQLTRARVINPFTGTGRDVAGLEIPIFKQTMPGQGSVQEAVSFGTTTRGQAFQAASRTTIIERGAIPSVSRSGTGTTTTTQQTGLDLKLIAPEAVDVSGTIPSVSGTTPTPFALPFTVRGGEAARSRTLTTTTQEPGQPTVTSSLSDLGRGAAITVSQEDVEQRDTGRGTRTVTRDRRDINIKPVVDAAVGSISGVRSREDVLQGPRSRLGTAARERLQPGTTQIAAPKLAALNRQRLSLAAIPATRIGQAAAAQARAQAIPSLGISQLLPATATPPPLLPGLDLDADSRRLRTFGGETENLPRIPETLANIDIISANLAEFETGAATLPGAEERKKFGERRRRIGPLARLRAAEVISGEAERPKPFELNNDRRLF